MRSEQLYVAPSLTKFTSIRRIAVDAVMKRFSLTQPEDFEAITMRLVHDSTTIPVPRIRRSLTNQYCRAIVMDYIPGQTLTQCWSSLSIWRRLGIIWTLRQYIRQLRNVLVPGVPRDAQFPGPVSSEPQVAQGPMFTAYVSRKHHHLFADHVIATDFSRVIGVRSLSLVRRASLVKRPGHPGTKANQLHTFPTKVQSFIAAFRHLRLS